MRARPRANRMVLLKMQKIKIKVSGVDIKSP
jgi:hypothetical protein